MIDVASMTLHHLAELIHSRQHSAAEITEAYLERIAAHNPRLNAYLEVFTEEARRDAEAADKEIAAGRLRGPLDGVPLAVKDIVDVKGHLTTAGGKLLPPVAAARDASVVERLRQGGAVLLGKLNLHEYAWGATTDNPHHGRCHNPWKEGYTPGGSSGGSGAAVAAGLCAGALGTDTLGSVRIPSSYCGCVGLKTSSGLVSNHGVYPLSWSLDTVGPLAPSVRDAALLLKAMAGPDPRDPYCAQREAPSYVVEEEASLEGLRLGVVQDFSLQADDSAEGRQVTAAVSQAIDHLVSLGGRRVDLALPELADAGLVAINIALADAAAIHADHLEKNAADIGADVRTLLEMGTGLKGPQVAELHHQRQVLRHRVDRAMGEVDCLLCPTTPKPAHPFETGGGAQVARFTAPVNLLGYPALSLPCGFSAEGLPLGLQIVAPRFQEQTAIRIAQAYEATTPWHERRPPGMRG